MSSFFPTKSCIDVILNQDLPGKLRGKFLQIYNLIYVKTYLQKFSGANFETRIILNGQEEFAQALDTDYDIDHFKKGFVGEGSTP